MSSKLIPISGATSDSIWQNWTPTHTNFTLGNGTVTARYSQIGKFVNASYKLVWGSTTSISGNFIFSLPVTSNTPINTNVGTARILDSGTENFMGIAQILSSTTAVINMIRTDATWGKNDIIRVGTPMTWATSDEIECNFSYEAV